MAFYPQLKALDRNTEGDASTTQPLKPTRATVMKRLRDNKEESLEYGPSFKDTKEFKSLISQFNNNFKFPWSQEEVKRKREQQVYKRTTM